MDAVFALLLGVPLTLLVWAGSFAIGAIVAVPLLLGGRSRFGVLRFLSRAVIDVLRGIPPIVWLFLIYFGLTFGSFKFNAIQASLVGLGLISAGYIAEIYRGALTGVHSGQWEASQALALPRTTVFGSVVGPQALRIALPSLASYAISLLKDSSIASTLGVAEIMFRTTTEARQHGTGLVTFFVAAALYIALSLPLAWLSRSVSARLRKTVSR